MYSPETETLDHDALSRLQSSRLAGLVARLKQVDSPYWSEKLEEVGDVSGVESIRDLPFTERSELREDYGMLAVPMSDVVRILRSGENATASPFVRSALTNRTYEGSRSSLGYRPWDVEKGHSWS